MTALKRGDYVWWVDDAALGEAGAVVRRGFVVEFLKANRDYRRRARIKIGHGQEVIRAVDMLQAVTS